MSGKYGKNDVCMHWGLKWVVALGWWCPRCNETFKLVRE